ncbi:hypothetical protein O7598_31055 [Micromonospora sp. WMMC241]|uniref:hypothetical protein n=1 Tax=Micromonospora sp. WMMC241 TaxID=3015159 RepID=UPI0022B63F8A|nr:hypothetical protein [Micromonospora sp. WMMC241]MCZ7440809.1 hypothetical protein [Micromonospora sp. WMMC241]MCZ7440864.1 hypothetical protein [Micromonospora sp. WMMC241]
MNADYEVAVDWAADGTFTAAGDDVTARVFDRGTPLTAQYGREQARAFAPLAGGRGQFELNNFSRDYLPDNTASPLAGKVRPGREVRIRATYGGVTYGLMRGVVDDIELLPAIEQRSVQVSVLDGLSRLRRVQVSTPLYQGLRTGQAVGLLLDAAGWPAGRRDLDVGGTVMPWWWADGTDAFTALQAILDAEGPGSLAAVDIDGRLVFRDRHHRLVRARSTTVQATWRSTGIEPCYSAPASYQAGWADIVNDVTYPVAVRVPSGQMATVWQMTGPRSLVDGETIALTAQSGDPFFGAVPPVAGVDFQLVSGAVTTALSRTSGQSVTVLVTAVGGPVQLDGMAVRAYPVPVQTTVEVHAEDPSSIAEVGRQSWPSDRAPTLASLPDATAIADVILAGRARRQPTMTVTFRGGVPARLRQQLARDLSDRVRVIDGGTGLDADCWVERIEHSVSGADHVTAFGVERIPAQPAGVLVLGDTIRGKLGTGRLGTTGLDDPAAVFIVGAGVLGANLLGH